VSTVAGRVLIRPEHTCESHGTVYDPPPAAIAMVCTYYEQYDEWGFAKVQRRTGGSEEMVRTTTYDHSRSDNSPRILGVITQLVETSTANGHSETRTTTYTPYAPDFVGMTEVET